MAAGGDFIELALFVPTLLESEFLVATLAEPTKNVPLLHAFDQALLGTLTFRTDSIEFLLKRADLLGKAPPVCIEHL
jgi:hypothetical protein